MFQMDLKARLTNKAWWLGIVSLVLLLSQQCGFDLSKYIPSNYAEIINTIFALLAALGITADTSTSGISDQVAAATPTITNVTNTTNVIASDADQQSSQDDSTTESDPTDTGATTTTNEQVLNNTQAAPSNTLNIPS